MNRRGFLKALGLGTTAAVVAPAIETTRSVGGLFVPSHRLDFGVPRALAAPEMPPAAPALTVRTVVLRPGTDGRFRFMPIEMTVEAYQELARSELYAVDAEQGERNAGSVRPGTSQWWFDDANSLV